MAAENGLLGVSASLPLTSCFSPLPPCLLPQLRIPSPLLWRGPSYSKGWATGFSQQRFFSLLEEFQGQLLRLFSTLYENSMN